MSTPISASAGMRLKQIQLFQRYSYFHSYKINQLFQQPPKKCNTICNRLTDWKNIENPPNMPMKSKAKHTSDRTSASCMLDLIDAFSDSAGVVESEDTLEAMLSSCGTRGSARSVSYYLGETGSRMPVLWSLARTIVSKMQRVTSKCPIVSMKRVGMRRASTFDPIKLLS